MLIVLPSLVIHNFTHIAGNKHQNARPNLGRAFSVLTRFEPTLITWLNMFERIHQIGDTTLDMRSFLLVRRIGHMFAAASSAASAASGLGAAPDICRRGGEAAVRAAATVAVTEAVSAGSRGAVGRVGTAERMGATGRVPVTQARRWPGLWTGQGQRSEAPRGSGR